MLELFVVWISRPGATDLDWNSGDGARRFRLGGTSESAVASICRAVANGEGRSGGGDRAYAAEVPDCPGTPSSGDCLDETF
jgi:hypothetical protein